MGRQLGGQCAAERLDAPFGCRVVTAVRLAQDRVDAGDGNDASAPALGDHAPGRLLATEKHAFQIVAEDEIPILLGHVDDGRLANQPGIVDQDVESAQPRVGFGESPRHLVGEADVALNGVDLSAAKPRDLVGNLLRFVQVKVKDRHFGSFPGKRFNNGSADPGGASGHNRFLALQFHDGLPMS